MSHGHIPSDSTGGLPSNYALRAISALTDGEGLPAETISALHSHFRAIVAWRELEKTMDIKAVLAALESQGLKLTTENLAPLLGQLVTVGIEAAQKGVSDLSHKAGVADPAAQ